MTDTKRKYHFSWDLLGDVHLGRPNLGPTARLEVYRLMQFTFRDVMEEAFGPEKTDELFFKAGKLAGMEFYKKVIGKIDCLDEFIRKLQEAFRNFGIGILRVEEMDLEALRFVVTVSEDLDCSGLPELGDEICVYDEGFISALLESFFCRRFSVKEVDCWCTGDRTCRFSATLSL